jgi:hypothetical protein
MKIPFPSTFFIKPKHGIIQVLLLFRYIHFHTYSLYRYFFFKQILLCKFYNMRTEKNKL